jgi:hypothetical protein
MNAIQSVHDNARMRRPATLVVLDRTHDLTANFRHGSCLMSRIFDVLPRADGERGADVTVLSATQVPPLLEPSQLSKFAGEHGAENFWAASGDSHIDLSAVGADEREKLAAFPAVASLAMPIPMSSQVDPIDNVAVSITAAFQTSDEKAAHKALIQALKDAIEANGGAFPPQKKRGMGAETLAYLQSLIASVDERPDLLYKNRSLLQVLSKCLPYYCHR